VLRVRLGCRNRHHCHFIEFIIRHIHLTHWALLQLPVHA
jgi:hypothetical protein